MKKTKQLFLALALLLSVVSFSQVGIGTTTPAPSSILDLTATNKAFLLTRVANTAAVNAPVNGMIIYDISTQCIKFYENGAWSSCISAGTGFSGTIATIDCAGAANSGTLTGGIAASGVNSVIAYTGGNGGTHSGQTVASTGVTGLTATVDAGGFASGAGTLTYTITGTPVAASGTASFAINIGGQTCTLTRNLAAAAPSVSSIDCASAIPSPFTFNVAYTGTLTIPYSGGNGESYPAGSPIASTGVTGLTATLAAGTLNSGAGNLTVNISGTPATNTTTGVASFAFSFGGQNCTLTLTTCGAFVSAGVFKTFQCFNLGATNTTINPNVPVQAMHGNYYQWGRSTVVADASTPAGAISGWNTSSAADGSWLDASKTNNDPCPADYRVPTRAQWDGVVANNTVSRTGSWANDPTNFTTAIHYGPSVSVKTLTLPAAGWRNGTDGTLGNRGRNGFYWSSTANGASAWSFSFGSTSANASNATRPFGFPVRCVSE